MGTTPAPSPDSKRAKGLRSPRQKKRPLTPDAERIANMALSRLADAASTEQVRMSQLSEIEPVDDLSSQHLSAAPHAAGPHGGGGSAGAALHHTVAEYSMSQDLMQPPDLPSQPDLPTPEVPSPAPAHLFPTAAGGVLQPSPLLVMGMPFGGAGGHAGNAAGGGGGSGSGGEGGGRGGSKATRRGPMDEMRQLVRILVKIIPHSVGFLASAEEGGGGNRISEERIKFFLDCTLGDAPRPAWGVPQGWGAYLSELLTWVLQKPISKGGAMRCAKREPGRSWEAIESELKKLGAEPATWPLPLTREGLAQAAKEPVLQPMPTNVHKRSSDEVKAPVSKRRSTGGAAVQHADPDAMPEVDLWQGIVHMLQAAKRKLGSTMGTEAATALVGTLRTQALVEINEINAICAASFGVLVQGPNGQLVQYQIPGAHAQAPAGAAQQHQLGAPPPPMIPLQQHHAQAQPQHQQQQQAQQQQSASQLSGMGPSQLLLASQGPNAAGSVFLPAGASQAQPTASQDTLHAGADSGAAHREVTKPQVMHAQASSAATSEAMHTDVSALHPPLDVSLPSTQDSERLYERLEGPVVPEPHNDADLQWPRSSQNGTHPEQQQPVPAQTSSAPPPAGEHEMQQPAASSDPAVALRKPVDDTASPGFLLPVQGMLPGSALMAAAQGQQQPLMLDQESLNALLASGAIAATSSGNFIAMSGPVLQAMPQMVMPQHYMQQQQQQGGQAAANSAAQQQGGMPQDSSTDAAAPATSGPAPWVPSLSAALH